jgi:hypothetical protein
MSTRRGLLGAVGVAGLLLALGACSTDGILTNGGIFPTGGTETTRLNDNFQLYAPFDNQRDWGPSFLVGPPQQLGDQNRLQNSTAPHATETAPTDPSSPPMGAGPWVPAQTLP